MGFRSVRLLAGLVAVAALAIALAAACTKEIVKEVPVEVVVEKEVVKEVVVERIIEVPVETMVEVTYPVAGSQMVVGIRDVGPAVWHTPLASPPFGTFDVKFGVQENLLDFTGDMENVPMLAMSWDFDDEGVTWRLRPGVPWHDSQYGTVNADDVHWSFEEGIREGTVSAHALHYSQSFQNQKVVDRSTLRWDWQDKGPDARWAFLVRNAGQGPTIQSKDYYYDVGEDFFVSHPLGTGPYKVISLISSDQIVLEGVKNHWRLDPGFESVRIIEVPEPATRVAMLKTGNVDITDVAVTLLDQVRDEPGLRFVYGRLADKPGAVVFLGGNWQIREFEDGTPNSELVLSNPWVGDYDKAGDEDRAKKIRLAMSYAIDRQGLVDVILDGEGCISFLYSVDTCNPRWQEKWEHPYDPEMAKQFLAEGGYADGFEFNFWIPGGYSDTHTEVSEALLPMWEAIGIKAKVDKSTYSARRPQIVGRTMVDAWSFFWGGNLSYPEIFVGVIPDLTTRVLWNGGYDYPWAEEIVDDLLAAAQPDDMWEPITRFWNEESHLGSMPTFGTITWVTPWVVGPGIGDVNMIDHGEEDAPEIETIRPAQ